MRARMEYHITTAERPVSPNHTQLSTNASVAEKWLDTLKA